MARRTKIIATLGPATRDASRLREIIAAGVDVIRLNLAHLEPPDLEVAVAAVREAAAEVGRGVGILADLPGPKMRTGPMRAGGVMLEPEWPFVLAPLDGSGDDDHEVEGDRERVGTTVANLAELVDPGDEIHLGDGAIVTRVMSIAGAEVVTQVVRGGVLRSRKGMHIPGAEMKIDAFTQEDKIASEEAVRLGVDFVGLSFVRDAEDIIRARRAVATSKSPPLLVAKIETRSAIDNLDSIVAEADAVMVARGDLGIQLPLRRVPLLQKEIIRTCNRRGVPVITATEMLESMTHAPLPTRAEVTDVANAVLDGTDALMLSGETAVGDYPVETVSAMAMIASTAEAAAGTRTGPLDLEPGSDLVSWAIARAVVGAAIELGVAAILCPTRSGATAQRVAAFRPPMPILGLSHREDVHGRLALFWGVVPALAPFLRKGDSPIESTERAIAVAADMGLASPGDLVAVVGGGPEPRAGSTDYLRIVRVPEGSKGG